MYKSHIKLTYCSAYIQSYVGFGAGAEKRESEFRALAITEMNNQEKQVVVMTIRVYSLAAEVVRSFSVKHTWSNFPSFPQSKATYK